MAREHIVKAFDQDIDKIESAVVRMGGMVEAQISNAVDSLVNRDDELGKKVRAADRDVDNLELEIDEAVVRLLALRQPIAQDLRAVLTVLKISANLERLGDYAKNIAKRSSVLGEFRHFDASTKIIKSMSALVETMLRDVLDAHANRDALLADDVRARDEDVDQMHNTLFRGLLTHMMEDARNISPCMHLLFIAKNIERMGDHVTAIAEQVHYLVNGKLPDEDRPKGDVTSLTSIDVPGSRPNDETE